MGEGGYKKSDLHRETRIIEQQKEFIIFLFFPNLNPPDSFLRANNICKPPRIHRCPKPMRTGNWDQDIYNVRVSPQILKHTPLHSGYHFNQVARLATLIVEQPDILNFLI